MSALTITFNQARAAEACAGSYRKMADHVGGVKRFGADTPLPITTVLDVCGLADALWAVVAIDAHRVLRLWSCDCAERVLPIFERERPDDRRPREAIRVSRLYAHGLATDAAWAAARAAAWAAAWAAAGYAAEAAAGAAAGYAAGAAAGAAAWAAAGAAAWAAAGAAAWAAARAAARDAAWDAARDAEEAWQVARLRDYLEGRA